MVLGDMLGVGTRITTLCVLAGNIEASLPFATSFAPAIRRAETQR